MHNLKSIFAHPVPLHQPKTIEIVKSLSLGVGVVYLIFVLLEPFNFHISNYNKYAILLIFVFVYFVVLFIVVKWLLPLIIRIAKINTFYIYHFVFGYLSLILLVTATHYIMQNYFNDKPLFDLVFSFDFFKHGIAVGLVPAVILSLIDYNKSLKAKIKPTSDELTHLLKKIPQPRVVSISALNNKEIYRFEASNLLYIKSDDNYINVFYRKKEDSKVEKKLIRTTLKSIDQHMPFPFMRVHRSYIINLNQIQKITGNSQGMKLSFFNYEMKVPVSRGYLAPLKKALSSS